jgi:hypothetical protein
MIRAFGIWYSTESISEWCNGDSKKEAMISLGLFSIDSK